MSDSITLFLTGDVMTGRGIDQILPHPSDPTLHEGYVKDARVYVALAEEASGPIPRPVSPRYIWGDILEVVQRMGPDLRVINLETSITQSDDCWRGKEVHYRMHPENIGVLTTAKIDLCVLANNHVLDWGYTGLKETLETLRKAGIKTAGAGMDLKEAQRPAIIEIEGRGKVIVFSFGSTTSGIPLEWAASDKSPGVNLLPSYSEEILERIGEEVRWVKEKGDIVVASIHWGGNWGYSIPLREIDFAHRLIDEAAVDLIHGHSSHHVKGFEVYKGKLILYGCGDFLNDYEGIGGYASYRADLGLIYLPRLDPSTGKLLRLEMVPTRIRSLRVNLTTQEERVWLTHLLNREGERFGVRVMLTERYVISLH
ncbi:MAG: CapA family protein [Desulfobacterota bacterium]|nr:CapA family protein [Thermodesulfobacteriota bacterium]